MSNANLNRAFKVKNDEFYTLYEDVQKGVEPYKQHFKDKKVLCNCNDGKRSNFYKFFRDNFQCLELEKLCCVSYQKDGNGKCYEMIRQSDQITEKEFVLKGDGDFRSQECVEFLDQADIVVTNPPFSLFREFIALLEKHNKKYLVLGNLNTMITKNIFPLIREEKAWIIPDKGGMKFEVPEESEK